MKAGRMLAGAMAGAVVGVAALLSQPAQAGLIGTGNQVTATYFFGTHTVADAQPLDSGTPPTTAPADLVPGGVDFLQNASDGATIHVGDTSIIITNLLSGRFCTDQTSAPCPDSFNGFEFQFLGAVDITGVTVDTATPTAFRPVALNLISPTDILVDLRGDAPAVNDQLVLNLTFPTTTTPAPEPASLLLLGSALLGVAVARRGRVRRPEGEPA